MRITIKTAFSASLLLLTVSLGIRAQQPFTSVITEVNKKVVKVYGAGRR